MTDTGGRVNPEPGIAAGFRFDPKDYQLSMRTSARPKREGPPTRSLLVHRLPRRPLAILRVPLRRRSELPNVFCESCTRWYRVTRVEPEWRCPTCQLDACAEYVVYARFDGEPLTERDAPSDTGLPAELLARVATEWDASGCPTHTDVRACTSVCEVSALLRVLGAAGVAVVVL